MSRKGNCWDNAVMERFFLSLKTERVWQRACANHSEAMTDIADYTVDFYNSVRPHSNWATCYPMPSSSNRQSNNLSLCPRKLDQHNTPPRRRTYGEVGPSRTCGQRRAP